MASSSVIVQKRYQYWSSDGIKWTKWFDAHFVDEQWQMKNKLKNEYREVAVREITPEEIMEFIHEKKMTDDKTEKKILKQLVKFQQLLKIYVTKDERDVDTISRAIMVNKYLDDDMKDSVINFIKTLK